MDLRLDLDTTTFERLTEIGRSLIPSLAPAWTDHNIHDPGMTLVDLLAFVADAQVFGLARLRRDERLAYARLLGVALRPPHPATVLVWPVGSAEAAPHFSAAGMTLAGRTRAIADRPDVPPFRTCRALRVSAAHLARLETHFADGRIADWTDANRRGGTSYQPFGTAPAAGDALVLTFTGALFDAAGTPIAIGVDSARPSMVRPADARRRLQVAVGDSHGERAAVLVEDGTGGLQRTGVIVIAAPPGDALRSPTQIIIRSQRGGFLRPPRLRRIALNVLPLEQVDRIDEEDSAFGTGLPGQTHYLGSGGLLAAGDIAVSVLSGDGDSSRWQRTARLDACRPQDRVFSLDQQRGALTFGNGINGMMPRPGAALTVSYEVCRGAAGNVAAGARWSIAGIAGTFGENREDAGGGRDADTLADAQANARARLSGRTIDVSAVDLVRSALALADLDIDSAAVSAAAPRPGRLRHELVLIVGSNSGAADAAAGGESAAWRAEIGARLAPRLPLGQRLRVVARRPVPIAVGARLRIAAGRDREVVRRAATARLLERFAAAFGQAASPFAFGRDIDALVVRGWLRAVDGVVAVDEISLARADGAPCTRLDFGCSERPQLAESAIRLSVVSAGVGRPT